ncbi:hypothetical protein RRG08_065051 [Elysia crispata]|uniref:Uncharacterized protein n=1 Tax=Elysia crispata TaxID=231223 RepID=A0AAE0ZKQ3_9GAST|nr:hypothetical protein RRG08_065051 [Elysia crispata]
MTIRASDFKRHHINKSTKQDRNHCVPLVSLFSPVMATDMIDVISDLFSFLGNHHTSPAFLWPASKAIGHAPLPVNSKCRPVERVQKFLVISGHRVQVNKKKLTIPL